MNIIPLTKICIKCKQEKPFELFTKSKTAKFQRLNVCKACNNQRVKNKKPSAEYRKKYYNTNKEKLNQYKKTRYLTNPQIRLQLKSNTLLRKYKLSLEEFQTLQIIQENKCAICLQKNNLVVDHCHISGKVRALLCLKCNMYLGVIENTILDKTYVKFIEYSQKHAENDIFDLKASF